MSNVEIFYFLYESFFFLFFFLTNSNFEQIKVGGRHLTSEHGYYPEGRFVWELLSGLGTTEKAK